MRFTAKLIASITLPEGRTDHIYWSDSPKGFGLRLRLDGSGQVRKMFIVQYRTAGRISRRMQLGDAEVRGLDSALKEAKAILGKVAEGKDPQGDRQQERQRASHIFKSVVADYIAAKRREVRRSTLRELTRYLTVSFKPLHNLPIDKIERKDVAARLTKISAEISPITAGRCRAALSTFFSWAMGAGLVERNPVVGTNNPPTSVPRERVLSNAEIAAIWHACGDQALGQLGQIVRLLILLGQRRQEVGGMRWSELGDDNIWRLPPERTKNHRAHTLPLPPMALDIIASVPQVAGRDHLFGERSSSGFRGWEGKRDLDAKLGDAVRPWRVHDIRRSVATGMADIGVQPHVIEQILNHVSGHKSGIAGIYNRSSYEREVRAALAMWADHVRTLVQGGERRVIPFSTAS
jgi:integrase